MRKEQLIRANSPQLEMLRELEEKIAKALLAGTHRIGSHSDDHGGAADMPCNCAIKQAIQALIEKEVRKALLDELENLWTAGQSVHADIRVGYLKCLTVRERIAQLKDVKNGKTT